MAAIGTYFFNGNDFAQATAVFTNSTLTTLAPDGFYSNAGIVRRQLNGVLLNAQPCSSCAAPCGSGVNASASGNGRFQANIDVANSTGAILVYSYYGNIVLDGMRMTYNSTVFNRFTCKGNHDAAATSIYDGNGTQVDYAGINNAAGEFTYMGAGTSVALALANSPYNDPSITCPTEGGALEDFLLTGGSYVSQGTTSNVTIGVNNIGTNNGASQVFTGVIPKTTLTPTTVNIDVSAPICGTVFQFKLLCPAALPSWQGTALQPNQNCGATTTTYYFAPNAVFAGGSGITPDTNTTPEVGNFVFTDSDGTTYLNDTNTIGYVIDANGQSVGIRNGVVVSKNACT